MFATREAHLPTRPSTQAHGAFAIGALVFFVALSVVLAGFASTLARDSGGQAQAFPASLSLHVETPAYADGATAGAYGQPADAVELNGLWFVLDTGNDRILVQDRSGVVQRVLAPSVDGAPALKEPMGVTADGRYLYIANTGASQVLILEPNGEVVKTLHLAEAAPGGAAPRPVGIAADSDGGLLVSDVTGNRILHFDREGNLQRMIGSGARASGSEGFNGPAGVALDAAGFIYVADILNGRVVKLAPDGTFVREFGRLGDTGGTFSRPKDVAVDAAGNVYVSDTLLAAVQVFNAEGSYLGFIGRSNRGDADSRSLFVAPAGLGVVGDTLYVVDRFAGLFAFQLPH